MEELDRMGDWELERRRTRVALELSAIYQVMVERDMDRPQDERMFGQNE